MYIVIYIYIHQTHGFQVLARDALSLGPVMYMGQCHDMTIACYYVNNLYVDIHVQITMHIHAIGKTHY